MIKKKIVIRENTQTQPLKKLWLFISNHANMKSDKTQIFYAEMMGKIVQNLPSTQCYQQNRQFGSLNQRDKRVQNKQNLLLFQGRKLTWTGISAMQLRNLSNVNRGVVYCNGLL